MKKILLADDNELFIDSLKELLTNEGFDILIAHTEREILQKIKSSKPSIAILDIKMPGMDGVRVCGKITSDPQNSNTAVIILSAHGEPHNREKAIKAGASAFEVKPYSPSSVLNLIKNILNNRAK